jgi:hypothetical protein
MKAMALLLLAIHSVLVSPVRAADFHLDISGQKVPELEITGRLEATYPTMLVRTAEEQLRHEAFLTMVRAESLEISISKLKAGINPRSNPKWRVGWTRIVAKNLAEELEKLDAALSSTAKISAFNRDLAKTAVADGQRALKELNELPANIRALETESSGER